MLRDHAALWRALFILVDLSLSAGFFLAAYALRFMPWVLEWIPAKREVPAIESYLAAIPAAYLVLLVTNSHFRLYTPRRVGSYVSEFVDLARSNVSALLLLLAFFFFDRTHSYSRWILVIFGCLNVAGGFLFRFSIRVLLRWLRSLGYNLRHVIIVGTGRQAQALLHKLRQNPWTGIRIAGFVTTRPEAVGKLVHGVRILAHLDALEETILGLRRNQVFLALGPERKALTQAVIARLADVLVPVSVVTEAADWRSIATMTDLDGLPIANLWDLQRGNLSVVAKRALDLVVAASCLLLLAPLLLTLALAVKLSSPGPVLYRQRRMGHDGRLFGLLKFRTMWHAAEEEARFTRPGDPRCTPLGRFLRRTSLDELPQLLNVLAGQMSLVGPRPERPVFIEKFRKTLPSYMLRHKLKAGMTGWAQVNGWRGDTSVRKRLQYDLYYLRHWSLALDLKILLMTVFRGALWRNAY